MDRALEHWMDGSLPPRDAVLLGFVERVNREPQTITREDVQGVVAAGWSEEAIYDAISVCALFNFYNRWCDAAGVRGMPPAAFEASGRRLAAHGYVQPEA